MADAPRPHVIQVRLSDDEKRFLDAAVFAAGLRRSEYVRRVLGGTSLGTHVVGRVEATGDGRIRGGAVAAFRPSTEPKGRVKPRLVGGYDTRNDRCPSGCGFTTSVGAGKRRCPACGWTGPV